MFRRTARRVATLALCLGASAQAAPITLDFEGIAPYPNNNQVQIRDFYRAGLASNGVRGPDLGVSFTSSALLLCLNTFSVDCSGTSKGGLGPPGSDRGALYFDRTAPYINVAGGFMDEVSLLYTQPVVPQVLNPDIDVGIEIWDGLSGTGRRLASIVLPHTPNQGQGCAPYGNAVYCPFEPVSLRFDGVARSVHFTGNVNRAAFDDITLGGNPVPPPAGTVPEPAAPGLLALAALGLSRRRQVAARRADSSRSM